MSAEYPHNAAWQHAQEQPDPALPPYGPARQPAGVWRPPVPDDRTNFALIGAGLIGLSTIFLPQGIAFFVGSHAPLLARVGLLLFFYLLPVLMVSVGLSAFKHGRRWNGVNQRRQMAAAWGVPSGVPLAEPQPVQRGGALLERVTITLKSNWLALVTSTCLVVSLVFLIGAAFALSSALLIGATLQDSVGDALHVEPFLLMVVVPLLVPLVRASWPQRIEITPEGLAVRHPRFDWARTTPSLQSQRIGWHEARLFAIREGTPGAPTVRYELSGPTTVVTFDRLLRAHWWSRFWPAQPFGDYHTQMEALLALISARTGLPLFDVRPAPTTAVLPGQLPPASPAEPTSLSAPFSPQVSEPAGEGVWRGAPHGGHPGQAPVRVPWPRRPALLGSPANSRTALSAVLVGLSFWCQVEGFPGVLLAKLRNDARPVALLLEIIAGLLAGAGLWFGHRAPGNQVRLLRLGYLGLALAIIGLVLFPFGPFVQ